MRVTSLSSLAKMLHHRCRNGFYPSTRIQRFHLPDDDKISWDVEFDDYQPNYFTSPAIQDKPWADPEIDNPEFNPCWNQIDGMINRRSNLGDYRISAEKVPLNPVGRTGIRGRGLLGRWGPNHAADPIITRWKRNGTGALEINRLTEKPILQFVAIQRRDSLEWAIPGGMVDSGESVSSTLKREFMEEAMNSLEKDTETDDMEQMLNKFFENGKQIYKGYVDDPRNTDNAWIETTATNFHDEDGSIVGNFKLMAGDDAKNVRWIDVDSNIKLYANHADFLKQTSYKRNAHW